jgi:hypothetical protein
LIKSYGNPKVEDLLTNRNQSKGKSLQFVLHGDFFDFFLHEEGAPWEDPLFLQTLGKALVVGERCQIPSILSEHLV